MLKRYKQLLAAGVIATAMLGTAGCSSTQKTSSPMSAEVDLIQEVKTAASQLMAGTKGLDADAPVLVATFANIDDLQQSSTFGRTLSEQFTSALSNQELMVTEVKMRDSLFVKERTGELILSRKLQSLMLAHDAQAVLLGTYAIGGSNIYVNARIVRTNDNIILGSHDFSLPLNRDIKAMLPRQR
ncbi:MAG: hypothetical protein GYB41_15640 [Oceanospirillales bacterium]|uniref:Putative component of type VI protein secretion system n=1 Tax=Marinobacterium halophilum TaxID=267374 RepID=A0A2P8F3P2_9GAMM|nr:FlgO family outer membrane protein [Marinobacterium halophilum]MBR9830043.1 hypothetical protein [Oceanospirillales bacterium]PSL16330.1 putative component of type VI protein secretion system [Marinobacterium halophilum]